ncbi:MAG: motility associated factor glycosyltransferase family protein [Spirochaetales bacterium]|jgi:hypothetical protein|nr:motility associated factor glycosyltransferase family protein [Spirochaetales bacterium]
MTGLFDRNISALKRKNSDLAKKFLSAKQKHGISWITTPTGLKVPRLDASEHSITMHSMYDPEKEGRRLKENTPVCKSCLIYGLGCGYNIIPFLDPEFELVLIADLDIDLYRSVFEEVDLSLILSDPRVYLFIDESVLEVAHRIQSLYLPSLHGKLSRISMNARLSENPQYFAKLDIALQQIQRRSEYDLATQIRFGQRWAKNIIRNAAEIGSLQVLELPALPAAGSYHHSKKIHVTAAGPSLETSLDALKRIDSEHIIVATDTSLPVLLGANIQPDYVVSIDCQIYSYHHLFQGIPEETCLVLDLASSPTLKRTAESYTFISGGHPLTRLLSDQWLPVPLIDTSGGNVTHAAVSFADMLRGSEIILHGADFSYPEGKLYARESYLYPYFRAAETRKDPLSSHFGAMLFDRGDISPRFNSSLFSHYSSELLSAYKENLDTSIPGLDTPFRYIYEQTQTTITPPRILRTTPNPNRIAPGSSWSIYGMHFRRILEQLPLQDQPTQVLLSSMNVQDYNMTVTLMPLAAAFAAGSSDLSSWHLLEKARGLMIQLITDTLG